MAGGMRDGALLLCGIRGVGKTALANALCRDAMSAPNYAFVQRMDCKLLRGMCLFVSDAFLLPVEVTAVLFLASSFFSVSTITHEPLHLA